MTSLAAASDEVKRLQARIELLEQERKHLLAIVEILQEIGGSLHFVDIVQAVARRLGEAFGLDRCSIFLAERNGRTVRLVASYEDPGIRNYVVDLDRYPELKQALQTGQPVFIADVATDPRLSQALGPRESRRVKSITVVPISWRAVPIGAIFLRSYRDGPGFSDADVQFCQVVASLTAQALRNAHRFERLQSRQYGGSGTARTQERQRVVLVRYLRRLLDTFAERDPVAAEGLSPRASDAELERLVDVTLTVLDQEAGTP
ncbi:MAG TPA: GAF domain-containing protein [Gemmatimonadales bacterium]|jgi:GAF domain-containing protein|nr:GAF domain-containing protein [Gemmatimonadales bacterium]